MPLIPTNTEYLARDFASLRERAFNIVKQVFPEWSDTSVANFGNMLVELMCDIGDSLSFYQDAQARESRLSDAVLRVNMLKIAYMLGYTPKAASAASAVVQITLDRVPTDNISFPTSFRVRTADITNSVEFRPVLPISIAKGTDPAIILTEVVNSTIATDTLQSNNLADQRYTMTSTPFVDSSEVVTAGGLVYTRVETFLNSSSTDRHYTIRVDNQDRAIITFGNGTSGTVPVGEIAVTYEVGGGPSGNVEAGTLSQPTTFTVTGDTGQTYTLQVTNPDPATGGAARESVEQIRERAPLSARRLAGVTVTLDQYESRAQDVAGVVRAAAASSDQVVGIPENTVRLYIVPTGGGVASPSLKAAVLTQVTETYPGTPTINVSIEDPIYVNVDITASVVLEPGANKAAVRAAIETGLQAYFAISQVDGATNRNVKFGFQYGQEFNGDASIPRSDLLNIVIDAPGVRKLGENASDLLVNNQSQDLDLNAFDFPLLGTVSLRDDVTGDFF